MLDLILDFRLLTLKEKKILCKILILREYKKDHFVYERDSRAISVYYVAKGSVGIYQISKDGSMDRSDVIVKGEGFGFSALLGDLKRNYSVQTYEDSVLISLLRSDYLNLCEQTPLLAIKILTQAAKTLDNRLYDTHCEYISLTHKLTRSNIII
jgi:CRP-like cAMP-binding protein